MKKKNRKKSLNPIKGTSSAFLLSVLIHAGLAALAGVIIVINIKPKTPPDFVAPPPVEMPKMPRQKLKMPVKNPSKPKASKKITAIIDHVSLSALAFQDLPLGGIGPGQGDGVEGIDQIEVPPMDEVSLTGRNESNGHDLQGTYYDVKRNRNGSYNGMGETDRATREAREDNADYYDIATRFLANWDTSVFSKYYRSPKKKYATCIMVPSMNSSVAPTAFGEDPGSGRYWFIHYTGKIVYPRDITFRFWGVGDGFIAVRVGGKDVFADAWWSERKYFGNMWQPGNLSARKSKTYFLGYNTSMEVGDWITLKAGIPQKIEIIMGDQGGLCALMLLVEVKGVKYPKNEQGGPILPVFKLSPLSHDMIDLIYKDLAENECCLTNGPVFNDFTDL